jgi:hypothetical protein
VTTTNISGAVKIDRADVDDIDGMIIDLVKEQLIKSPVLLYCTEELKIKIATELDHYFMNDEAVHIDEDLLRSLDTLRVNPY